MISFVRTNLVALSLLAGGSAFAADSPLGVWIDDSGRGAVEISQCGDKLCGKLVWLKDAADSKACGTAIIGDAAKVGKSWDGGWIYSPEKDYKYDVELTPDGADKLTVLGYLGTKLFSQEMTWTRAPADLKRCNEQLAKATDTPVTTAATPSADAKPGVTAAAPGASTGSAAKDAPVQTAQAETEPEAKPAARKPAKTARRKMCRVDAPFVRVEFPCDDD